MLFWRSASAASALTRSSLSSIDRARSTRRLPLGLEAGELGSEGLACARPRDRPGGEAAERGAEQECEQDDHEPKNGRDRVGRNERGRPEPPSHPHAVRPEAKR